MSNFQHKQETTFVQLEVKNVIVTNIDDSLCLI